jgi:hypothetical protein
MHAMLSRDEGSASAWHDLFYPLNLPLVAFPAVSYHLKDVAALLTQYRFFPAYFEKAL